MVRRGWLLSALLVVAACGGDDDAAPTSTTAELVPATLPAEVDAGRGFLVLGGVASVLTVTSCALAPTVDAATGVTTELTVAAQDAAGRTVDVVRSSFTADVPTVTDTVRIGGEGGPELEAMRADAGGRRIDLRLPNPGGPLLEVDVTTGTVRGDGVFGPVDGGEDDPANVGGELLLRCP